jgi:hypothetical protein
LQEPDNPNAQEGADEGPQMIDRIDDGLAVDDITCFPETAADLFSQRCRD